MKRCLLSCGGIMWIWPRIWQLWGVATKNADTLDGDRSRFLQPALHVFVQVFVYAPMGQPWADPGGYRYNFTSECLECHAVFHCPLFIAACKRRNAARMHMFPHAIHCGLLLPPYSWQSSDISCHWDAYIKKREKVPSPLTAGDWQTGHHTGCKGTGKLLQQGLFSDLPQVIPAISEIFIRSFVLCRRLVVPP